MGAAHPLVSVRGSPQNGSNDWLCYAGGHGDYRHAAAAALWRHHRLPQGALRSPGAAWAFDANRSLGPLLPYYRPRDPHTLAVFCSALVIVCAAQGVFFVLTRQILIGLSRDIEFDLRNDPAVQAGGMEPNLRAQSARANSVALHERFEFGAHGARTGIVYSANTIATMALAVALMFWISATLSVYVLLPCPSSPSACGLWPANPCAVRKIQASLAVLQPRLKRISPGCAWCAPTCRGCGNSDSTRRTANTLTATCV